MDSCYRSWVEISLSRIAANYRSVCQAVGEGVEVLGVVKADAYGHGALQVARVLTGTGARWLAVSSVDEGVVLREGGVDARILVMGGVLPYEVEALWEYNLTPAVHSFGEIAALATFNREIRYHLKIDTGMSRLGVRSEVDRILDELAAPRSAQLEGLMTHFASAADFTSQQTETQMATFQAVCSRLSPLPRYIHTASTNAIAYARRGMQENMVRPGHALYGYVSSPRGVCGPRILEVKPALKWKARILVVKDLEEGSLIGYGGTFRAPRRMRVGVLAVGYADGYPHRLSNRGRVIAAGKPAPILGTVSMDLTTVDLSHAPHLGPGDEVTLLGEEGDAGVDAQQIARFAGTISYNVLCGIGARVRRVYVP
ncbi:MAG: alanine racemase [Bryobacteraceae bacterium]